MCEGRDARAASLEATQGSEKSAWPIGLRRARSLILCETCPTQIVVVVVLLLLLLLLTLESMVDLYLFIHSV